MDCIFLDEFGHDGPYVARTDRRYNQSPVFGFAGLALPYASVQKFASEYVSIKSHHLNMPRERAVTFEKKGGEVFHAGALSPSMKESTRRHVANTGHRLLNLIQKHQGRIYYNGIEKFFTVQTHNSSNLHVSCMRRAIERINKTLTEDDGYCVVVFDEHGLHVERTQFIIKFLFNKGADVRLIDPPFQGQSDFYNTIQAADWICALLGKVFMYKVTPAEWAIHKPYFDHFHGQIEALKFRGSFLKVREPGLPL